MTKALYRQYRPKTFDQVLGQDRIVNVLKNQVDSGMISHAYLFAGERGCGKTSCAKIFAKAINCKNPNNGSPCLECDNCRAIDQEMSMDVVEMDAASNRRIDDIRQLKETVVYPPNNLKYKVYIIDEAHMITREAFNALLKIMEEPPSHLVFILATTEIEKIPKTILSRVQKFEFNKIGSKEILQQIDIILNDLGVSIEQKGKDLIIKKAKGAMRDALSILDQVLSTNQEKYTLKDINDLLGIVDSTEIDQLLESVVSLDQKSSLEIIFSLRNNNKSNKDIIDSLITYIRDIMIIKSTKDKNLVEDDYLDMILARAEKVEINILLDYLEILLDYSSRMKYSDNTDLLLELCIIRLIQSKDIKNIESRIRNLEMNNKDDLVTIVNKVIDSKLKNINLSNIEVNSLNESIKEDNIDNSLISEEKNSVEDDIISENNDSDLLNLDKIEDKNKGYKRLDPSTENMIKNEIIKTSGAIINTMFTSEGFNYSLSDGVFHLYYKDQFFKSFLINKEKEISEIIRNFTNKDIEVKIVSDEQRKLDNTDKNLLSKERNDDVNLEKLKKIFGDEIIIE